VLKHNAVPAVDGRAEKVPPDLQEMYARGARSADDSRAAVTGTNHSATGKNRALFPWSPCMGGGMPCTGRLPSSRACLERPLGASAVPASPIRPAKRPRSARDRLALKPSRGRLTACSSAGSAA